jgi:UPF0755 protein
MSTLHDKLAQIERNGAAAFSTTSLSRNHASVTKTVRRHRTARVAATAVAGVSVVGAGSWGAMAAFSNAENMSPAGIASPSIDTPTVTSSSAAPSPSAGLAEARRVALPPGKTVADIASYVASVYDTTPEEASDALTAAVEALAPEASTTEGWVIDGTFDFPEGSTLQDAADALVGARVQQLTDLGIPRSDWQTVLTKASMVEREAPLAVDKPKVARVIENRLAQGMRLELDSTVKFYSTTEGAFTTQEEREAESPYNTYKNLGLPPGAIATPSLESIQAVVSPAEGDWLFFVTVNLNTGETLYASTFEGHLENVQVLQEWASANG